MNTKEDKAFAVLRTIFGMVWMVDASLKWTPSFINGFSDYLTGALEGQPALAQSWIHFWINVVNVNPHFFAIMVATAETLIAFALIFGFFTEIAIWGGILLTLIIWSTAEGFGGPYVAGSTDIGSAIIYVIVFSSLWLGKSWRYYSLDSILKEKLPFLGWHW
jgi:uncharacterized membrane protein YphA (DoxX/SURF4 family)